jgi:glutamate carboxypeptidase
MIQMLPSRMAIIRRGESLSQAAGRAAPFGIMLLEHFSGRREAIIALIRDLVRHESNSRDEPALDSLAGSIAESLSSLGANCELFHHPGFGSHLRARLPLNHDEREPGVLVIGHIDTVWPAGTLARLPFRVTDEGSAHGPGIFDMKAAIAMLIEALRAVRLHKLETRRPLTLLLTCDEEIGSCTSRPLIEEEARRAAAVLVLEPPIPGGTVKTARKGVGGFTIRAFGRAAHAGLDPTKGINAIVELAHHTLTLAGLNDPRTGSTVSVGRIEGGTAVNVVPAEARIQVDVRFWDSESGAAIEKAVKGLQPVLDGARLEISGGVNRPPMARTAGNVALFELARGLANEIGFELADGAVGGGSDGNFTSALGIPTLDGLGVDGAGAHADHEHILLDDLPRRTALLTRLLQTA